ncbi:hypothetical protein IX336_000227 [Porphyromonas levii]|nr:hypothetical protein [Porphyromonas levii]
MGSTIELKKIESENKRLLQKVGQLTIDCDFLRLPARMPDSK